MNKEERLREYINKDYSYINYKTGVEEGTDFDKFCIQHCKDIEELLEENQKYKEVIYKLIKILNNEILDMLPFDIAEEVQGLFDEILKEVE